VNGTITGPTYYLRVLTLGDESFNRDGQPIPTSDWRSSRSKEFFLYLLFNGPTRREELSLMFWPDHAPSRVRSNFHTTLYRARSALGDNVILYEGDVYRLNPHVSIWCDAKIFTEYVQQAQMLGYADVRADDLYRKALSYYHGDFLPTLDTEWIMLRRTALHEQYIRAQIGSGHCARVRRDYEAALSLFRRVLLLDPYREDAYRGIFTCYAEMGERHLLIKHYQEMIRFFQAELGISPSPETSSHVQQLTRASSS
jgi:DNA-binding SARP family transcriptional activator